MPVLNPKILDNSHKEVKSDSPFTLINKTGIFPPVYSICETGHNSWLLCDCFKAKYIRLMDLGVFDGYLRILQNKTLMEKI